MANRYSTPASKIDSDDLGSMLKRAEEIGRTQAMDDILNWLQAKYIDVEGPTRSSPEAIALLTLTSELVKHFRK